MGDAVTITAGTAEGQRRSRMRDAGAGLGRRVATWLRPAAEPGEMASLPGRDGDFAPTQPGRHLYGRIGDFLFGHALDLTPLNFGCALDYLAGRDLALERAIAQALGNGEPLTDAWIEQFFEAQSSGTLTADVLADMARQIETELASCIGLMDRSQGAAADYGRALEAEMGEGMDAGPRLHRLLALTQAMIEQSRETEAELRASQQRKQILAHNLRKAREAAEVDHLTGLPNRRAFEQRFRCRQADRKPGAPPLFLALCDIDHFKRVNDEHGHDAGDRVLQFLGDALRTFAGGDRFVARMGGEEFAILLPACDAGAARQQLEDFREPLARRTLFDKETRLRIGQVTFSAGMTETHAGESLQAALKRADRALYEAKRCGRNRIEEAAD